jgi:hypothetical protein
MYYFPSFCPGFAINLVITVLVLLFFRVVICSSSLYMFFLSVIFYLLYYVYVPILSALLNIWLLLSRINNQQQLHMDVIEQNII